ncbi:MAG: TRAM domain-containing protein [Planctomycetes bacterium]|nr:TRAM domain-containing protein [Planctomycetota bacterium]
MRLSVLRLCFSALVIGLAIYGFLFHLAGVSPDWGNAVKTSIVVLGLGFFAFYVDWRDQQKQMTTISALGFGTIAGLLIGALLWMVLEPFIDLWFVHPMPQITRFLISLISCYISISFLLQTKDEFRFLIPYVEFSKQVKGGKPLVLDTSVIIDGRIADICDTRIIDAMLVLPRFVLQELQAIADSSDKLKRNRGRRGLDILKRLQSNPRVELEMHDGIVPELRDADPKMRVDERLVFFTKALNGKVVTNDFNLNKIAQLQGVDVINLNEVSNALKTIALPGEVLNVRVMKAGDQAGQGIGYLEDGTMVVVDQGRNWIGNEISVTVTSVLQTPAGRMIFGKIEGKTAPPGSLASEAIRTPELKP